jgi:hypothetical protein
MISLGRLTLYVATAGALLTAAATAMGRLESNRYVLAAIIMYILLLLLGLRRPELQMFADATVSVTADVNTVALLVDTTLADEGVPQWVRVIEQKNARVTLVLTAQEAEKSQAIVSQLLLSGHAVADRGPTVNSRWAAKSLVEKLEIEQPVWDQLLGEQRLWWLAPTYYTERVARIAEAFERDLVVCSVDLRAIESVEELAARCDRVLRAHKTRAILRFQDGPVFREAIAGIVDAATQLGVGVGTLV